MEEVAEFEATRSGVKGLVDSGITKVPWFFKPPPSERLSNYGKAKLHVPIIDLQGAERNGARRLEVVDEIRKASESWGFFQLVNHGIPLTVVDAVLESTRRFHEQPKEDKALLYSTDPRQKVRFYTFSGSFQENHVVSWRDVLGCSFTGLNTEAIPPICREEILEYRKYIIKLKDLVCELVSEALGLSSDFLDGMDCVSSEHMTCLYYPACPEPDLCFGIIKHTDPTFLTLLAQDESGGLQFHYEDEWVDVPPLRGALIANLGDLMQLITNDKFKSAQHRVMAVRIGTRVSTACFFSPSPHSMMKTYGPIKELKSEKDPPVYREVTFAEFLGYFQSTVRERTSALPHFKL